MVKNIVLTAMAIYIGLSSICFAGYRLVEDEYVAKGGDSLDSITTVFMRKNTYGKREHNEFRDGIVELNPWIEQRRIHEGDKIKINYWVETDEEDKK